MAVPTTHSPTSPERPALRLALTMAGTIAASACLWTSGRPRAAAWSTIGSGSADERVVQCLRLAGLAIGAWLVAVTGLAIVLRWCGARLLSRLVERLLPAAMRRLVHLSFGVTIGITAAGSFIAGPAMAAASSPATTVAVTGDITNGQRWPVLPLPGGASTTVRAAVTMTPGLRVAATHRSVAKGGQVSIPRGTARTSLPEGPAPLVVFGPAVPVISAPTISAPTISAPTISAPTISRPTIAAQRTWTVERGDHLWSIAERVVHRSRPGAGEHEVARYWLRLIETNRHHLVDPDNPDLIRVGQQLDLPPLRT